MDTFKIFLNTYKSSLYMVLMPLGFFIVLTILRATMPTADFVARLYNIIWMVWFFLFSLFMESGPPQKYVYNPSCHWVLYFSP